MRDTAYEKEESCEAKAKDERSCEISVVHDPLVNATKRIQNRHRLGPNMRKVYSQLCSGLAALL